MSNSVTPWTTARQASLFITTPGVYPNSCPLSRWCHPTISSSVVPFSSHLHSFPASGSFLTSHLFASGGLSIGTWASVSSYLQDSFRIDCFDLLAVQGSLKCLIQHQSSKASILQLLAFFIVQLSHPNLTTAKTMALTICTLVSFLICCLGLS